MACSSYDTCCSWGGQRGKAAEGCLQREIVWSIITSCQLPRHVAYQWVVYCLQRFKGHKRALNPALKPGKQDHSKAEGTLGGQQSEQPHEANHERHSKQPNICHSFSCLMSSNLISEFSDHGKVHMTIKLVLFNPRINHRHFVSLDTRILEVEER